MASEPEISRSLWEPADLAMRISTPARPLPAAYPRLMASTFLFRISALFLEKYSRMKSAHSFSSTFSSPQMNPAATVLAKTALPISVAMAVNWMSTMPAWPILSFSPTTIVSAVILFFRCGIAAACSGTRMSMRSRNPAALPADTRMVVELAPPRTRDMNSEAEKKL